LEKAQILVTGGAGFIGTTCLKNLVKMIEILYIA